MFLQYQKRAWSLRKGRLDAMTQDTCHTEEDEACRSVTGISDHQGSALAAALPQCNTNICDLTAPSSCTLCSGTSVRQVYHLEPRTSELIPDTQSKPSWHLSHHCRNTVMEPGASPIPVSNQPSCLTET